MNIVEKDITEIREYENNPRNNDGAVEAVAESIKQFGFKVPIIIDSDSVIIAGHTRLKAARRLGLSCVPCIVADDLTEEKIRAFRLAENKTGELAEWDFELLERELAELTAFDVDMSLFGFDESVFEELPDEIELEREEIGGTGNIAQLKYGSTIIPMTDEEDAIFDNSIKAYLKDNGTLFGFVSYLMCNSKEGVKYCEQNL